MLSDLPSAPTQAHLGTVTFIHWIRFDQALHQLAEVLKPDAPIHSGVWGVPRGGLPLAVALSHHLDLPLLKYPENDAIIVDDIFDSGKTMRTLRDHYPRALFVAWFKRQQPPDAERFPLVYFEMAEPGRWLIFPWEDPAKAHRERREYIRRIQEDPPCSTP